MGIRTLIRVGGLLLCAALAACNGGLPGAKHLPGKPAPAKVNPGDGLHDASGSPQVHASKLGGGPVVTCNAQGCAAAWVEGTGGYASFTFIVAQRLDASGQPMGAPFEVAAHQPQVVSGLYAQLAPDNTLTVAWVRQQGGGGGVPAEVYIQRFGADNQPLAPYRQMLEVQTSAAALNLPFLGFAPDARFVIAWTENTLLCERVAEPDNYTCQTVVKAQRFDADGNPLEDAMTIGNYFYNRLVAETGEYATQPVPAMDAQGNYTAVWGLERETYSQGRMVARHYDAASGMLTAEKVLSQAGSNSETYLPNVPNIALLPGGGYVLLWYNTRDGVASAPQYTEFHGYSVQRYADDGTPLGPRQDYTNQDPDDWTMGSHYQYLANIVLLPNGDLVGAGYTGVPNPHPNPDPNIGYGAYAIYVQRFPADGSAPTPPARVSSADDNPDDYGGTLALTPDGRVLVGWVGSYDNFNPYDPDKLGTYWRVVDAP